MYSSSRKRRKKKNELRILIAEDNAYNSYSIREMLINLGYNSQNITIVDNGQKCVNESLTNNYDVILMDILMPVMGGIEASRQILSREYAPAIVAVSASVQNEDKTKCKQVGIDNYITKPITKEILQSCLDPFILKTDV